MVGESRGKSRVRLPLLKVASGGEVEALILSDAVASVRVHWIGRRSYLCPGGDCPCCLIAESRWVGFLLVRVCQRGGDRVYLLEVTGSAYDRLVGLLKMEGVESIRGVQVSARRERAKAPLLLEPLGSFDLSKVAVVPVERVYDALATVYGMPSFMDEETVQQWEERASVAAGHAIRLAMEREAMSL